MKAEHHFWGYKRTWAYLRYIDGLLVNKERVYGLMREHNLTVKPNPRLIAKSRFRQECLNQHWFVDMDDARCKIEAWRLDYNERRPHSSIGSLTPVEFVKSSAQSCLSTLKKAGFSHSSWP